MFLIRVGGGRQTPAMAYYLPNTCDGGEMFMRRALGNTHHSKKMPRKIEADKNCIRCHEKVLVHMHQWISGIKNACRIKFPNPCM